MATFDDMVEDVASRLNLTSIEAKQRIGIRINDRYKRVTSSIGMITSRRQESPITVDASILTTLPDLLIDGMEKVLRITYTAEDGRTRVMKQLTYDEMKNVGPFPNRLPRAFAIKRMGAHEVTITLDSWLVSVPFDLQVEGYDVADVLADDAEPFLPEDFHDILVEGAMSDELRKMEKPDLAAIAEGKYEQRLSDLRMFIAKNAYMDVAQGRDKPAQLWYRPWFSRISMWD